MTITLTKTTDGFDINSDLLPAPLALSTDAGKGLAAALYGDLSPAFKTDKCVFAPQSREPVGLWVAEDGSISLWLGGVNHPLTADEAKALGAETILAAADYQVGDEVITVTTLSATGGGTLPIGSIGKVAEVRPEAAGEVFYYKLAVGDDIAANCPDNTFSIAPPEQDYRVIQDGIHYVGREVIVRARTENQAYALGNEALKALPDDFGWSVPGRAPEFDPTNTLAEPAQTAEQNDVANAAEGWTVSKAVGIRVYVDSDNAAKFTSLAEAVDYVADRAFRGSPRHADAMRKHLTAIA